MRIPTPFLPLLAALAAAGCGTGDPGGPADQAAAAAVQTANLTGLYETPAGAEGTQLCILDRATGQARFGLVLREDARTCSGDGLAVRSGETLRLEMEGDEPCTIEARIAERRVSFPAAVPASCAYYCAPGASLAGVTLDKVGGAAEDAMRATDLIGDALCG